MSPDFAPVFKALKPVFKKVAKRLVTKVDTDKEYMLVTKSPSPFPQHKGEPLFFGSVRIGKAYVSLHLMPLYMNPELPGLISPALKKRMQGKACFNFKAAPEKPLLDELERLSAAALEAWAQKKWL